MKEKQRILENLEDKTFYCEECGEECHPKVIDEGVGRGEAWGVPYNDVRLEIVSQCCEGYIEEKNPNG